MKVTAASAAYRLKRRLQNFLSNITYSPSNRQTGAPMIYIRSTFRIAFDLCKNISLVVLFGSNGNSYTVYTLSDMCVYMCKQFVFVTAYTIPC